MKKSTIISILIAVAMVTANSALIVFAFEDNMPEVAAQLHQEAEVSQEERDLLEDAKNNFSDDLRQFTLIAEGSIMEEEAIALAEKAIGEKFGADLGNYVTMNILAGSAEESAPYWFVSFAPKNLGADGAVTYIARVNSETGAVISVESNANN